MSSASGQDIIGQKKGREVTLRGVIISGVFNIGLGVALAFAVLSGTMPQIYTAKPDAKTGKVPPQPTSGLWYWAGNPSGGWEGKQGGFLAGQPITLTDGDMNGWAQSNFKSSISAVKPPKEAAPKPTTDVAKAKADVKDAEADVSNFKVEAGSPNFHTLHDPQAPGGAAVSFQVALPFSITVLGTDIVVLYQTRGQFVPGAQGPRFEPYYSSFGSARFPPVPGLAGMVFNTLVNKFAASDAAKKYAEAWAKYGVATIQDGSLSLAAK